VLINCDSLVQFNHGQLAASRASFTYSCAQLAEAVGLTMLLVATAVFGYYTIWTLLMVRLRPAKSPQPRINPCAALCGRGPCTPLSLPSAGVGHSHTRHTHPLWYRPGRFFSVACHD